MKKSTLALAVAAALVGFGSAAYADTTLYGSARVSVDYDDVESTYSYFGNVPNRLTIGNDTWDVVNNTSRLGVRGEEDLGGGLAAIYQFEFGVDPTEGSFGFEGNRPKWVGLKGTSWGSFTAGTQWTPYYNALGIGDIFNSRKVFSSSGNFGTTASPNLNAFLGNAFGLREDNSLIYTTPNWSGFSAQAMLVMNGTGAPITNITTFSTANNAAVPGGTTDLSDGIDLWNVGATYKNGPFFLGASYMALNNSNDTLFYSAAAYPAGFAPDGRLSAGDLEQWGLAVGYNAGPFAISLTYEDGDLNTVNTGDSQNIWLAGQYTFGNNVIRAAYGYLTADQDRIVGNGATATLTQGDQSNFVVGYQYNFSKRTRVFAEYLGRYVDDDRPANVVNFDRYGDSQTVSIGTRVDF